jgi:hypothetical protein
MAAKKRKTAHVSKRQEDPFGMYTCLGLVNIVKWISF